MSEIRWVWELEVWSRPGLQLDLEYGKCELETDMWKVGVERDVFLGLSEVPSCIDSHNLRCDIESGALAICAFSTFCTSHGLIDSMENPLSAARFLEYSYGRSLAWVHIPCNAFASDVAVTINSVLVKRDLVLLETFTNAIVFNSEGLALLGPNGHLEEGDR